MLFKNKKNYSSFIVGLPILFIFITASVVGGLNIYNLKSYHDNEILEIEKKYIEQQKEILKKNVEMTNTRIDVYEKSIYKYMKKRLKNKINVATIVANELYLKYRETKSEEEIKEMIFVALNKISWEGKSSYFWVIDYDGIEHIAPPQYKEYLGKNLLHLKDANGNFIIKDEMELVKKQTEGYLYNTSTKLNNKNKQYKQISYVKDLGFYNWYVGTAEFLDKNVKNTKEDLIQRLSAVSFNGNSYVFIHELLDINGGDKFAKMLVNKNRSDLIGKYLSDSYKDVKGKEFRKEMIHKIRKKGYAWVEYHSKKPDGTIAKKLSYFYLNKKFNWIVANGFYYDDIEKIIDKKNQKKIQEIKRELISTIIVTFILASILSIFSILLSKKIESIINKQAKELVELNESLEEKVKKEIDESSKKDLMIFRQSKMATMGEMIGNIAHQWRQPLNSIGAIMMKLEMINEIEYDDKRIVKIVEDTNKSLRYMSKTIDDFRNFFTTNKEKEEFYAHDVINEAISIIKVQLNDLNIKLTMIDNNGKIEVYGHKNELVQVLLNLINNAKDAIVSKRHDGSLDLLEREKFDAKITITIEDPEDGVIIYIKDNAGGIPKHINDKIFEPYFTTKFKSKGTGIGLYMSKMIVEKDMNGSLTVENDSEGAVFKMYLSGRGRAIDVY
ncbi:MAG: cache domain-containing protein [Campylobacterota bacterium]|nr:cache domain-containing protein [Campylobacterota bacterium]